MTKNWKNWESIVETKQKWKTEKLDLHNVLFRWCLQECQDTHDKIYGLLGLVSKPKIKIDISIITTNLFREILRLEKEKIYARRYGYASEFTARLLTALGLDCLESARQIKTEFLKGYRE